jgi:flavin reductase
MNTDTVLQALSPEAAVVNDFKAAMRRFAVSVSIITTADGPSRSGMTATAVSSLSTQPPSLLVCINRNARLHAEMSPGRKFCVNFLTSHHADLSSGFGGRLPPEERFALGAWVSQDDHPPYLSDAQANVFCTVDGTFDYGSHTIFVGKVQSVRINGAVQPLVYADGKYFTLTAQPGVVESISADMDFTWL